MPFFQPYLAPEATFFRQLLSELEEPKQRHCAPRRQHQTFNPRFDIAEVPAAYELYGEVPGLEQQDLSIEFSDAQTLVIKGKTQRATPATQAVEKNNTDVSDNASEKSHNATVEDEYDEADTPLATPATTATAVADEKKEEKKVEVPKPQYWVTERRVGEFSRSFSFAQRVEQDEVRAELKNGVLHVVVPKSQKPRKVAVSVN